MTTRMVFLIAVVIPFQVIVQKSLAQANDASFGNLTETLFAWDRRGPLRESENSLGKWLLRLDSNQQPSG
jgi:hypothetical protein